MRDRPSEGWVVVQTIRYDLRRDRAPDECNSGGGVDGVADPPHAVRSLTNAKVGKPNLLKGWP